MIDSKAADHFRGVFEFIAMLCDIGRAAGCTARIGCEQAVYTQDHSDWICAAFDGGDFTVGVLESDPGELAFYTYGHRIDKDKADALGIDDLIESRWPSLTGPYLFRRRMRLDEAPDRQAVGGPFRASPTQALEQRVADFVRTCLADARRIAADS